jgi:hypothetical protein
VLETDRASLLEIVEDEMSDTREPSAIAEERLILFDTNIIERRYLSALLRGERCRDFDFVNSKGFTPAVHVHSLCEICHHAKLGTKRFPWMDDQLGYPGGIERGKSILRRLPNCDVENNVYYWFGLCEEWRGIDWDGEAERWKDMSRPEDAEEMALYTDVRREFSTWKFALSSFCERIWDVAISRMRLLTDEGRPPNEVFRLQQEVSLDALLPTEDLPIVFSALIADAVALVTEDQKLLQFGGLSLSLNYRTAFVHPDGLREAIEANFDSRWSKEQTRARTETPRA